MATKTTSIPTILKGDTPARQKYKEIMALQVWRTAVQILGIDLAVDYCQSYSRCLKADQMLRDEGEVLTSPNGYAMPSPWLAIRNRASADMAKFAKLAAGVVIAGGKKGVKELAAKEAAQGKFAPRITPPKLVHLRKE